MIEVHRVRVDVFIFPVLRTDITEMNEKNVSSINRNSVIVDVQSLSEKEQSFDTLDIDHDEVTILLNRFDERHDDIWLIVSHPMNYQNFPDRWHMKNTRLDLMESLDKDSWE